jgi:hypothetical protein
MRFCALDTIHHTAYNKLESKLPDELHCTLPSTLLIALDCTLIAYLAIRSQSLSMDTPSLLDLRSKVSSQDSPKYTPGHALKDAPNCTRWHTPSLLDCTLPSKLSRRSQAYSRARSQIHSQLHLTTPPSLLDCTLPNKLSRRSQAHSRAHSQVHSQLHLTTPPSLLDYSSQVSSRDPPKYNLQREDTLNLT